jgi:hypothetical protein
MLIAGTLYNANGYSRIEESWLFTTTPEIYLLDEKDLFNNGGEDYDDLVIAFFATALKESFPNLILEIPFISSIRNVSGSNKKRGIVVRGKQLPMVYFKKNSVDWKNAEFLFQFLWKEIPIKWDKKWFIDSIKEKLTKNLLRKKLTEIGLESC